MEHGRITRIDGEYGIVQANGSPVVIEYHLAVLEQVRSSAAAARAAMGRGGVETGGVLLGRIEGTAVRIAAAREVACEHAFGPAFALSERDEEGLRRLLDAASGDPGLAGMEPVGWYRSARGDSGPGERDNQLHAKYFPNPHAVALIVWPGEGQSARAAFFARNESGALSAITGEFPVEPAPAQARRTPAIYTVGEPAPEIAAARAPAGDPAPLRTAYDTPSPALEEIRKPRSPWQHPAVFLTFAAGLALGAMVMSFGSRVAQSEPLGLKLQDAGGQLFITWKRSAAPFTNAQRGVLEVNDSGRLVATELDAEALRSGAATYARTGPAVNVRLRVFPREGKPTEEFASYLGQPVETPAPDEKVLRERDEALRRNRQLANEAAKLRGTVQTQATRIKDLEQAVTVLRERVQTEEMLRRRRY